MFLPFQSQVMEANKTKESKSEFSLFLSPILLIPILGLGGALRFFELGAKSYWVDEMFTVIEGQQSIHQLFMSGKLDQPPAYYLPLHVWVQIFGTTEVSTRSFSALAGIGSIVLVYLIGRELFGKTVGALSAFLMAISELQIHYSQQARYYSFFELTTLLSFLFFILALRSKRTLHFALYGVASILMVYSHTFGVFILAAQNLFFILQRKKYRRVITTWLICQALVLLALVPDFCLLFLGEGGLRGGIAANTSKIFAPSPLSPLRTVFYFVFAARGERSWGIMLAIYAAAGAFLAVGTWIYAIRRGKSNWVAAARGWVANLQEVPDVTGKLLLLSCWLLCPILLPFILSMLIAPIYLDRYLIGAAPALYLLLALGIFSARKVVPIIISLGVLVIMVAPGLGHYYATDAREQWKEAAIYVEENSGPDEVIVFAPIRHIGITRKAFNWYYRGPLQQCSLGGHLIDPVAMSGALTQCLSGRNRFWVIIYQNPTEPAVRRYESFFLGPEQTTLHLIKARQFVGISVYSFELTK